MLENSSVPSTRWRIAAIILFVVALVVALGPVVNRPEPARASTLGATGMAAAAAKGQLPIYLDWSGITSTPNAKHSTSIKLTKFNWELGRQSTTSKVASSNVVLVKQFDQYTPQLLVNVANGTQASDVEVWLVHDNSKGQQIEALEYKFKQVVALDDAQSNSSTGQETVSATFSAVEVTYFLGTKVVSTFGDNGFTLK